VDLDPVDLEEGAAESVQPLCADSVVVGDEHSHRVDSRAGLRPP
jgi:hypothetical protein